MKTKAGQTGGCCGEPDGVMVWACSTPIVRRYFSIRGLTTTFNIIIDFTVVLCSSDKPRHEHELVDSVKITRRNAGGFTYDERQELISYGHYYSRNSCYPMYREKRAFADAYLEDHVLLPVLRLIFRRCVNGHLWAHHSEERRKGLFGKERVQTKTLHDMVLTDSATSGQRMV